ncbi:DUF21-domain-containing protein [Tothia fuscella]|uniref:DUF21-domain-containing protein n=1 Tax=Tothia fuscella TaxID=1048955 RepID=A0A9P4NGU6_9PEZI|nr:DUF21-domain-containing protein [Tothia fuscella]
MADLLRLSSGSMPLNAVRRSSSIWPIFRSVPAILSIVFCIAVFIPLTQASPLPDYAVAKKPAAEPEVDGPGLWAYLTTAAALVLLGGAFAGLTIALMGQDEIYLQVIATSGEPHERRNAKKVLRLLKRGKHWVLVTLLLGNVITNETLPIVLDRSLGGGWPAVLGSTVLIVIFGEIAPQSVCVRYGLPIGAWMSPFVLGLMWLLAPIAWPTAKLLDYLLGEDHGTTYKKAGLKSLVTLHRTLGESPTDRLNQDEVTIISAVLDLKDKSVGSIMTPMSDVFTLAADTVLDEQMMEGILSEGYSRIPIYAVDRPRDFVGMLLVKMLITYDPEDCLRVRDFQLATLPETRPETSCLDIVNFFQEGKSHMILVSDSPGEAEGALGVVTLEDVIEELIGEEIVDESDVFIDVSKAIRRLNPAPRYRISKPSESAEPTEETPLITDAKSPTEGRHSRSTSVEVGNGEWKTSIAEFGKTPPSGGFMTRRRSSGADPLAARNSNTDVRQHLKHLGPSNAASRPKSTRINTVKIKPGAGSMVEQLSPLVEAAQTPADGKPHSRAQSVVLPGEVAINESTGLLSAGRVAKDGVHAVGYGALSESPTVKNGETRDTLARSVTYDAPRTPKVEDEITAKDLPPTAQPSAPSPPPKRQTSGSSSTNESLHTAPSTPAKLIVELSRPDEDTMNININNNGAVKSQDVEIPGQPSQISRNNSTSTLGSLQSIDDAGFKGKRMTRSGSITEHTVEVGGVTKVILETTSSSDDEHLAGKSNGNGKENEGRGRSGESSVGSLDGNADGEGKAAAPKKKRKKRGGKKGKGKEGMVV